VASALVLLAASPPPGADQGRVVVAVAAIVSREIAMSALREWAAAQGPEAHGAVRVSALGKGKTAAQMVGTALLLFLRPPFPAEAWGRAPLGVGWLLSTAAVGTEAGRRGLGAAGLLALDAAAALSVVSFFQYFRGLLPFFFP